MDKVLGLAVSLLSRFPDNRYVGQDFPYRAAVIVDMRNRRCENGFGVDG